MPIRVLHVLGGLDRGGIETWLAQTLPYLQSEGIHVDFAVYREMEYELSAKVTANGSRIFAIGHPSNPLQFVRGLWRLLGEAPSYDVVHSHLYELSAIILAVAKMRGVACTIAHSHNQRLSADIGFVRRGAFLSLRIVLRLVTDVRLACSALAGVSLFTAGPLRFQYDILYCGIEAPEISAKDLGESLAADVGITSADIVLGHVGRFEEQKNHRFLVDVFAALHAQCANSHLVLVGTGSLRPDIEDQVRVLGLSSSVHFLGSRSDVRELMRNLFDVLLLPSLHEGLPIVLLESQSVGLPALVATSVTREAVIIPDLIEFCSLTMSPQFWADKVLALAANAEVKGYEALVRSSHFGIENSSRSLCEIYRRRICQK